MKTGKTAESYNVTSVRVFNDNNDAQCIRLYLDKPYKRFARVADTEAYELVDSNDVTFFRSQFVHALEEYDANLGYSLSLRISETNANENIADKNRAIARLVGDMLIGGAIGLEFQLMKAGTLVQRTVDGEKVEVPLERDEIFKRVIGAAPAENGAVMIACDKKRHQMELLGVAINPIEMLDALEKIDSVTRQQYAKRHEVDLAKLAEACKGE